MVEDEEPGPGLEKTVFLGSSGESISIWSSSWFSCLLAAAAAVILALAAKHEGIHAGMDEDEDEEEWEWEEADGRDWEVIDRWSRSLRRDSIVDWLMMERRVAQDEGPVYLSPVLFGLSM